MSLENIKKELVSILKKISENEQILFWLDIFRVLEGENLFVLPFLAQLFQDKEIFSSNQERFQKIVEFFPLPIVISDNQKRLIYVNTAFTSIFGYDLIDLPNNKTWFNKAYPDIEYRKKILQTAKLHGYDPLAPRERKIVCKNGEIKEVIMQDIKIQEENLTFFRDITAQRESERDVLEKEQEYREIVENLRDMIFLLDSNLIIKKINPAVSEIMGYSKQEMIDYSALDFIPNEFHTLIQKMVFLKKMQKTDKTLYEIALKLKNGEIIPVEIISRIIFRENKYVSILVIARDITQRKKQTEEKYREQNIKSIGLLAGGIAHDFNNILVSILGNIDLLKLDTSNFSEEQNDILNDLEAASFQARDLAKQLLTFSKGGLPIRKVTNINSLIRESARFVLRGSNCKPKFRIQPALPHVKIDSSQISQVLNNVIINARQSMPKGGIITIYASSISLHDDSLIPLNNGRYIKIAIQDTGMGIPKKNWSKIFDPYFSTKIGGNGLGLTMAYSIVRNHGGHITFTSEINKGTRFEIYLPISENQDVSPLEKKGISILQKEGKILVMDDDQKIHSFLQKIFHKWGYHMDSCFDGNEILQHLQKSILQNDPYNLIFMDLTIPGGMGGKDAIKIVKNSYPKQNVIVFSGYSDDPVLANHKDFGFCDYLIKPFTIEELKKVCEKWI
ncbi:PAS domain-containing hybrid sensor histidine kinase/response regulator [Candidatus Harpocratesius sp.]